MTGFTINWFLKDRNGSRLTEKLPPRLEDWTQKALTPNYEQPFLAQMVQLARQLRLQNMTKERVLEKVIQKKLKNIQILEEDGMCSMGQVKPGNQKEAFSKLASYEKTNKTEGPPSEEDIRTGYELFQAVVYCPTMVIKLFRFIDQLLSSESERTIILTFVNIFQSGAITDKTSFTLAKQFYNKLASTLNLKYGNVLLASSTNAQLKALIRKDWPFFSNNTNLVERCLQESHCDGIQDVFQKLGIHSVFLLPYIYISCIFFLIVDVLRELSLHPVHLTPDEEGNLPPSALVPFCSYQGNNDLLGHERPELDNLTICDKFRPTILEGQRCYSLDIAKLVEKPTKSGKTNGLFLLLDPNPYQQNNTETNVKGLNKGDQSFKLHIHTLAQYSTFGPGSYGMSSLKRMTGTESFQQLPDHQKKCLVHNREECQTRKYLDQVQRECNCSPWALQTNLSINQVKTRSFKLFSCRCCPSVVQRRRAVLETKL